jgi:hypothetical protein
MRCLISIKYYNCEIDDYVWGEYSYEDIVDIEDDKKLYYIDTNTNSPWLESIPYCNIKFHNEKDFEKLIKEFTIRDIIE